MKVKKLPIYMAQSSLDFLRIFSGSFAPMDDDKGLPISTATNLCIQAAKLLISTEKLPLTPNELLFCCDAANGSISLIDAKTPDDVSISSTIESFLFTVLDAVAYPEYTEKWKLSNDDFAPKVTGLSLTQIFVLVVAVKQFWSKQNLDGFKRASDCEDYAEWAKQWLVAEPEKVTESKEPSPVNDKMALLAEHHKLLIEKAKIESQIEHMKSQVLANDPSFDFELWEMGNAFQDEAGMYAGSESLTDVLSLAQGKKTNDDPL